MTVPLFGRTTKQHIRATIPNGLELIRNSVDTRFSTIPTMIQCVMCVATTKLDRGRKGTLDFIPFECHISSAGWRVCVCVCARNWTKWKHNCNLDKLLNAIACSWLASRIDYTFQAIIYSHRKSHEARCFYRRRLYRPEAWYYKIRSRSAGLEFGCWSDALHCLLNLFNLEMAPDCVATVPSLRRINKSPTIVVWVASSSAFLF